MRPLNALFAAAGFAVLLILPLVLGRFELSIATELLIFSLLPLSLDLMMGYAGLISFGHAAYFGLGAYTSAIILKQTGVPLPLAIVCGAILCRDYCRADGVFMHALDRDLFLHADAGNLATALHDRL